MNRNTLTGLLLMGAIIMLFMFINSPSEEQLAEQRRQKELAEQQASQPAPEEVLTIDTVSPGERAGIIRTIRQNGEFDAAAGVFTLTAPGVTLSVSADSTAVLSGMVKGGNSEVSVADILSANYPDSVSVKDAVAAVALLRNTIEESARYQGFARFRSGTPEIVASLSNDVLALEFSNLGGVIANARLLDPRYTRYDSTGQVCPIAEGDDMYGFQIAAADITYDTRQLYFEAVQESDSTVLMKVTPGDGAMLGFRYTLPRGESYLVKMDLVQSNIDGVIPTTVSGMQFKWNQRMARNEEGRVFESQNSAIYYMLANGDVDNLSEMKTDAEKVDQPLAWVAFKNQFFSTLLVPGEGFSRAQLQSTVLPDTTKNYLKDMELTANMDYSSTLATPASMTFYIGPNYYPLLSDLSTEIIPEKDLKLTKLIPLGWSLFRWINTWIVIPVFDFLGGFISNYGIVILLLTIFIKILLFPFTYKSYMSQARMRVLAPEIKAINDKFPGKENAMRRQQETMALYNRAGANPMSGCLPMLLQLPILIAMFRFFPSAIELRGESFLWAHNLAGPDYVISLPFSIPFIGDKLSLFCLLMTVVNIIYTRINMQNQPGGSQMAGMKWMMYLMPVMFLCFFNNYAAGLSYYYLLSLLITIIQTYIFRQVVNEEKVRATMKANAAKPRKKSGFMARLEEAQRKQQAMLREQQKQRGRK
ncbi:MAG: membrane protein insertase YidC [Paramuribaculum sp.]|nr:membrane protein insertase YidC [Paramuribaculum sp.]